MAKKMVTLETERLVMRPFVKADAAFIITLLNTEGWLKNIGDRKVKTIEQAKEYLTERIMVSYRENGFGMCAVVLKTTNEAIGMCGLLKRNYLADVDIGFAFLPQYMGQGYGIEIATKTLRFGFQDIGLEKIVGITIPSNTASIRLLQRIGLRFAKNILEEETKEELCLFELAKMDYQSQPSLLA